MAHTLTSAATCAALVALAATASAQAAASGAVSVVQLYAPACNKEPYDRDALVEAMKVELAAFGVRHIRVAERASSTDGDGADLLAAVVLQPQSCDPSTQQMSLEVFDRVSSKRVERNIVISDVKPMDRARELAIAVAELLQASWAELQPHGNRAPALEIPPQVQAFIARRATAQKEDGSAEAALVLTGRPAPDTNVRDVARTALEGTMRSRAFPSRDGALLGLELAVRHLASSHVAAHLGVDLMFGEPNWQGDIAMTALELNLGVSITSRTATAVELGPRVTVGYVWGGLFRGNSVGWEVLLGLGATARLEIADAFVGLVGIESGYGAVLSTSEFDTEGVYLGMRIGVAAAL